VSLQLLQENITTLHSHVYKHTPLHRLTVTASLKVKSCLKLLIVTNHKAMKHPPAIWNHTVLPATRNRTTCPP